VTKLTEQEIYGEGRDCNGLVQRYGKDTPRDPYLANAKLWQQITPLICVSQVICYQTVSTKEIVDAQ